MRAGVQGKGWGGGTVRRKLSKGQAAQTHKYRLGGGALQWSSAEGAGLYSNKQAVAVAILLAVRARSGEEPNLVAPIAMYVMFYLSRGAACSVST